jgi:hypothetical protein
MSEEVLAASEKSTGHTAVDAAVASVQNAARLSAQEQLGAYEAAHQTLREVLSSIEE